MYLTTVYLHIQINTKYLLYCKTILLLWRWDACKVRGRFGGMGRFKGGLRCKRCVNSVIINVITEINYICNYI